MPVKHSLVCDTLGWVGHDVLATPHHVLSAIKDAGYDGADLPGYAESIDVKALKAVVDEIGIEVPEVLGAWGYYHAGGNRDLVGSGDEVSRNAIEYAKKSLDQASELGAQFFEVCAAQPGIAQLPWPNEPIDTLRERFAGAVSEICEYAAPLGITILLEPLNMYEGYPGVLTTLEEATGFIEDLQLDNLGLQPDCFHMNMGENSVVEALEACGKYARVLHLNESHHKMVGTGHIDFKGVIKALKGVGFDGYFSFYAPLMPQDVFQQPPSHADLHPRTSYGTTSLTEGDSTGVDNRPDLKAILQEQLDYIKEIEAEVGI